MFRADETKSRDFEGSALAARYFKGTHIIKSRGFTRSGRRYATNWVRFLKNVVFKRASDLARVNLGKLLPAIYCDFRGNPSGFPLTAAFLMAHILFIAAVSPFP